MKNSILLCAHNSLDVSYIAELSDSGYINLVYDRINDFESDHIVPGSVFVYLVGEKIKRWTDKRIWISGRTFDGISYYIERINEINEVLVKKSVSYKFNNINYGVIIYSSLENELFLNCCKIRSVKSLHSKIFNSFSLFEKSIKNNENIRTYIKRVLKLENYPESKIKELLINPKHKIKPIKEEENTFNRLRHIKTYHNNPIIIKNNSGLEDLVSKNVHCNDLYQKTHSDTVETCEISIEQKIDLNNCYINQGLVINLKGSEKNAREKLEELDNMVLKTRENQNSLWDLGIYDIKNEPNRVKNINTPSKQNESKEL